MEVPAAAAEIIGIGVRGPMVGRSLSRSLRAGLARRRTKEQSIAAAAVAAQVALLASQALLRRRRDWPTPAPVRVVSYALGAGGAAIVAAGGASLGSGLTASPLPNARTELRTDGLYRRVRHPIYTGVIAISCARTLSSGDRRQARLSGALVLLLLGKSHLEERALSLRFDEYPAYAGATPRFVPRRLVR